jgi:hypothetical protein
MEWWNGVKKFAKSESPFEKGGQGDLVRLCSDKFTKSESPLEKGVSGIE